MKLKLALTVALLTSALAQQVSERRVMYSRIVDLPEQIQAIKSGHNFPKPNVTNAELRLLTELIRPTVSRAFASPEYGLCETATPQEYFSQVQPLQSAYKVTGSFTQPATRQMAWIYTLCSGEGVEYQAGLAITEAGKLKANYLGKHIAAEAYSVRDVNLNGLSELLMVVPSNGQFGQNTNSIQLYEFPDGKVTTFGTFTVGGPPSLGPLGDDFPRNYIPMGYSRPIDPCERQGAGSQALDVLSRIIYVEKGVKPKFFSQSYRMNCDFLASGLRLAKVGDVQEVKLTPFKSPFTRTP